MRADNKVLGSEKREVGLGSGSVGHPGDLSEVRSVWHFPRRDFWVFLFFLAFVVARYIQIGARRDILATVRFEFLLGMIVVGLACWQLGTRKPALGNSRNILILISLLFVAMLVQLPFAADPVMARKIFNDRVIKFAILTFLMVVMIESPRFLRLFLVAFLFSVFYITLESVRGLITGGLIWENQGILRLHGAVPIYKHPNSLGGVAMGTVPFVVFLMPYFKRWWQKLWLLAVSASSLVCVVYSGSRTAYVGLLAFVLWWWLQSKHKGRWLVRALILGVLILMILPGQYIERFQSIGGKEKEGRSKETRMVILEDAWQIFTENPLGVGVASFPAVRMQRFGRMQDTHNLFLEVGTNLGVQGLAVFLILVGAFMVSYHRMATSFERQRQYLRRVRWGPGKSPLLGKLVMEHDRNLGFLAATAHATGGFIFIRLALGMFGMDLYEVYWWFGAGIAIVLSGMEPRTRKITQALAASVTGVEIPREQEGHG